MLRLQVLFRGVCLGILGLVLVGCGSSDSASQGNASSHKQGSQHAQAAKATADSPPQQDPKQVIEAFLRATKQGDKQTVRALMTTKAVEEMEKHDRSIDPQGSPSAKYEVKDSELVEEGAHVLVHWIDGPEGQKRTTKMIWVLKPEKGQWRVAGVIIKLFEDLPPVPFDFEDPEDMEAKERFVEEEFRRRAANQAQAANQAAGQSSGAEQQSGPQSAASGQAPAAQTAGAATPGQKRR